jgi:hypothetical protein
MLNFIHILDKKLQFKRKLLHCHHLERSKRPQTKVLINKFKLEVLLSINRLEDNLSHYLIHL